MFFEIEVKWAYPTHLKYHKQVQCIAAIDILLMHVDKTKGKSCVAFPIQWFPLTLLYLCSAMHLTLLRHYMLLNGCQKRDFDSQNLDMVTQSNCIDSTHSIMSMVWRKIRRSDRFSHSCRQSNSKCRIRISSVKHVNLIEISKSKSNIQIVIGLYAFTKILTLAGFWSLSETLNDVGFFSQTLIENSICLRME